MQNTLFKECSACLRIHSFLKEKSVCLDKLERQANEDVYSKYALFEDEIGSKRKSYKGDCMV